MLSKENVDYNQVVSVKECITKYVTTSKTVYASYDSTKGVYRLGVFDKFLINYQTPICYKQTTQARERFLLLTRRDSPSSTTSKHINRARRLIKARRTASGFEVPMSVLENLFENDTLRNKHTDKIDFLTEVIQKGEEI